MHPMSLVGGVICICTQCPEWGGGGGGGGLFAYAPNVPSVGMHPMLGAINSKGRITALTLCFWLFTLHFPITGRVFPGLYIKSTISSTTSTDTLSAQSLSLTKPGHLVYRNRGLCKRKILDFRRKGGGDEIEKEGKRKG